MVDDSLGCRKVQRTGRAKISQKGHITLKRALNFKKGTYFCPHPPPPENASDFGHLQIWILFCVYIWLSRALYPLPFIVPLSRTLVPCPCPIPLSRVPVPCSFPLYLPCVFALSICPMHAHVPCPYSVPLFGALVPLEQSGTLGRIYGGVVMKLHWGCLCWIAG